MRLRPILATPMLCSAALASPALAQEGGPDISISGDARVRAEALDGQFRAKGPDSEFFVSSRVMVEAEVDFGPVAIGGEIRDSRALSIEDDSVANGGSINTLEPLQGWIAADFDGLAGGSARLKAGRFTQSLGSGLLVGTPGFANNIVSYAGAQFDWKAGNTRFIGFWARPFTTLPADLAEVQDNDFELDRVTDGLSFFGGHLSQGKLAAGATGELYAYRLAEDDTADRATTNRKLVTIGGRFFRKGASGRFDFDVEAAGQFGTVRATASAADTNDMDVRASFAHAQAGYTFATAWTPRIGFEIDYGSGDKAGDGHYSRFDMLYGARRILEPVGIYGPLSWANMIAPGIRVEAKPGKRFDTMLALRGNWLDSRTDSFAKTGVRDSTGRSGNYAGTQIEGRVRYWLLGKKILIEAGAAYLAKGRFLSTAPNAPDTGDTRYGYLALSAGF